MKTLTTVFILLICTSALAQNCFKLAINSVRTEITRQDKCPHGMDGLGNFKVENIVAGKEIDAKMIEVSYYCEAGVGAVVVTDWECKKTLSVTFTPGWE